ncbi:glycosyltransferase [Methanosphaera cuniculi]|uniref:glycosyltransferase n=1 Tax=Methanosphaera cuniculi TaxID=1077256 RepID=UPI0026F29FEB|nr:glycosyltransferase [Methanosphaera cuniculi]
MEVKKEIQENIDKNLKQLLKNSKFFNTGFYKKQNPKLRNTNYSEDEIIANYLINNKDEKFPPSKFFDIKWYVKHNPDVEKTGMDQLIHFIKFGQQEGRLYRYTPVDFKGLNLFDKRNNLYEIYRTIYHSDIFDIDYYLNNNGDFDLEGYDPIIHYILIGAERGYNPSRKFNTKMHMQNHDLNKIITNPLYHYIKYGKDNVSDEEFIKTYTNQFNNYNKFQVETVDNILSHLKEKVSIIIPIYNAYEETRDCIRSVLLNTRIDYELILINDCSPDKRIRPLLDSLEGIDNIRVIHNKENQGFIKNVNMGMTLAGNNDVVLLNSDTIVTPRWLTKILISAYKDPRVATVTPLANASDISAVNLGIDKDQLLINKNAYKLEKLDYDSYFEAPTGNGFCLFIKREALNELGLFDIKYILGYGEETDFTARAFESGWKNLRVFDTFIYHREHASFTKERTNKFKKENKLRFMEKYPDVYGRWNNFIKQPKVNEILRKTKGIQYLSTSERILYVTQIDKKGNPEITDKFYEIAKKYDTHILAINDTEIFLYVYDGISKFRKIYSKKLVDKTDDEIRTFYFNMFTSLRYNLLYVRQIGYFGHFLYNKIPSFIKLTKPLEIPVIYEGNNYYSDLMNEINRKLHPIKSYDETINNTHNRISFKDKKMVVYTAITGGFDDLVTPSVINEDFDYVCFTDNPELKSDFWDIRLITGKENELDNIRKARRFKMFPHIYLSEYDYSLWIDGNFDIIADVEDYIKEYSKNNKLLAIPHDARDCIYEEAHATIEANKDYPDIVELEMDKYEKEGFPHNYGLIASGIIFRDHHDPEVIKLMEDWFSEVMNYSQRCQLSFNYVCWKNNFQYDKSDLYCFKNQYFIRTNHADNFENFKHIKYQRSTKDQILTNLEKTTTIIIPIYNRYDDTVECIKSIIKYTHIPYEIVVIDDNSTDKRINPMLMEFSEKYDNIHLLSNTKKEGFGKCVNIGLNF